MKFENPQIFLLLIPALLVIWFLLRQKTHLGFSTFKILGLGLPRKVKIDGKEVPVERVLAIPLDLLQKVFFTVVVCATIAVLAGPYIRIAEEVTYQEARDLVVTLDTSGSMESVFQKEKKIETARRAVREFIEARTADRNALISFESSPQLEWPLSFAEESTGRHDPILQKLEVLEAAGGTDIAKALFAALEHFDQAGESQGKVLILVSDGISTIEDEEHEEIVSKIEESGIRLYWILIRSDETMTLDLGSVFQGQAIATVIRLVEEVDGKIFETTPEDLANAFTEVEQLETSPVTFKEETKRIYRFQPFLLIALVAFVPAIIIELVKEV